MSQYQPPPQGTGYPQWQQPLYPPQPETYYAPQPVSMPGMPPYEPEPEPQHSNGALTVALVCAVLLAMFFSGLTGYAIGKSSSTPTQQPATTDQSTPADQTAQSAITPTSPPVLKWTTTQNFSGNGSKKTAIFPVPNDWRIVWKCTGFTDGSSIDGNMGIAIYDDQNRIVDGLSEACKVAGSTGTSEEHQGGNVYLSIDQAGNEWSVQIQELK